MSVRAMATLAVALGIVFAGCQREKRDLRPAPARTIVFDVAAPLSDLRPGGPQSVPAAANPQYGSAYSVSEGQRLFDWYNCSGCHFHAGGGIGPPLEKKAWLYGGDPANLFDTIVKGRPNGMPSWAGRIPEYQVWQLVAYIRSLNGEQPRGATPARPDTINRNPQDLKDRVPGATR
jgi:cytochrome c oxidase cbb3-type subunit III